MPLPEFLQTFFGDPAYVPCWTMNAMMTFAWQHLADHSVVFLSAKGERVYWPYHGCWIIEQGMHYASFTDTKRSRWYAAYYHDEDHIYAVFTLDENGKAF